ncbi:MAG: FAD-binding oxidoreductase [Anaerolineales bacterium]|nr:FAD-binding oxidoreductase [Anaerolineales bacterium]
MKTTSFWTDNFPRPADLPISPLPERVDVAIVGGGYTGLSAARTLAKGGASVAVLEQREIGGGASSVNGGQVAPGLKLNIRKAFKMYGPELGRELWQASVAAVRHLEQTLTEEGIDCDYTGAGGIALAYRPSHYQHMAEEMEWMAREVDFHELELVPPERIRDEIGSDVFPGGLVEHLGGGLHPAKYVYGLACATARAGAKLCERTEVRAIRRPATGGDFELTTNKGPLKAGEILLATNGYTGPLVPQIQRRVFPVGSYMITTEPLSPELQRELSPKNRVMYSTKWFLNYFRLTPDGRMSMGGRNNLSPNLDLVESAHNLYETMTHIFPQLRGFPVTHSWTGRLGITFDLAPHIGRVDGIYYAFGYGGHGVAMSGYLGQEVASLISGRISRSPFADIPHQTYFFYRGKPWFLPLAAAYYRFLDAVS